MCTPLVRPGKVTVLKHERMYVSGVNVVLRYVNFLVRMGYFQSNSKEKQRHVATNILCHYYFYIVLLFYSIYRL